MSDSFDKVICDKDISCEECPYCDYGVDCFSGREYFICVYPDNPFFDSSLLVDK